ncbi:PucR family transcriptional regulator [Paenibacillus sp. E194]|uniref:PucR family transcriptional regulator n=1 Tax=Paenibacillus sp. E194 TaxID=1458845 RepID=UPI0005C98F46|nr:helix-turn-helix domain-containing protein [Paenibacillus sp. E194]KJB87193.1 PucR family transcriptional regulator [Paenibacillus sp. E194]
MNEMNQLFEQHFDSLEAVADLVSDLLHCPVTIEDAGHKLLAYSTHHPGTDPARIATIIGRRVPEQVISALWRDGTMQRLMSSMEPIRIQHIDEVGLGNRLAVAIRHQQDIIGYIWVLDSEQSLPETALQTLSQAAQAAKAKLMQHQLHSRRQDQHKHDFFWQLLTGHHTSEQAIREHAARLSISFPPEYFIWMIQFSTPIQEKLYRHILYTLKTTQHMRMLLHVIDHDRLIMMSAPVLSSHANSSANLYKEPCQQLILHMKQRFGASPVRSGASTLSSSFLLVSRCYEEAITTLNLKKAFPDELDSVHSYGELGYYRHLPLLIEHHTAHSAARGSQQTFHHIGLEKLRMYDAEHASGLVHTIEQFLRYDCNVKKTAEALHIHTNTLMYRLKRIAEVGGVDVDSMDEKMSLFLELKLHRLATINKDNEST